MIKYSIILFLSIVISFNSIAMGNKETSMDIKTYIDILNNEDRSIQELMILDNVDRIYNQQEEVVGISIKNPEVTIDSIKVGSEINKIYDIYPNEWIKQSNNNLIVLLGQASHYGVVSKYIKYISADDKVITEIQIGYTSSFCKSVLPVNNSMANQLLQGKWKSAQGRELEFKDGLIKDTILDQIYIQQQYMILSPNELIIYRLKDGICDKVKLRFWITEDQLYLFAIDELGYPIERTIEMFIRISE